MAYAKTQEGAIKRVKIKRELRRLGNRNFKNDDPLKALIKELNQSTLIVKKKGNKYHVRDVTQFDGDYGSMTEKQLMDRFG